MIAYKALCPGGRAPISGYAWPRPAPGGPGPWVVGRSGGAICRDAVHGCRVADLPWWLQAELWEAEFDGPIAIGRHKISAPRARLLRRVDAWDAECARRFAQACADRAAEHSAAARWDSARIAERLAEDAARCAREGDAIVTAYIAAQVAARTGGPEAMTAERTWQAGWLLAELGLRA
jgi:hypothetical protein